MTFKKKMKPFPETPISTDTVIEPLDAIIKPYVEKLASKESAILSTLSSVNELLTFMTNLDYVKGMITNTHHQAEMVETLAAESEALATSTENISINVKDSAHAIQSASLDTDNSVKEVHETFGKIESGIQEIYQVKETIQALALETVKINALISVIKSVADQTNMLSLNASIEAARAGEHGRGFAVVADEIKKLADHTKQQVDHIRNIVQGLNEKINTSTLEIDRLVDVFGDSKVAITSSTEGIENLNTIMHHMDVRFSSIASQIEEQTATTEAMSTHLQSVYEKSNRLKNEANRTGKSFFDISQSIDKIRVKAFQSADPLRPELMIELSITDHLMWKWRIYNMVLGYVHLDATQVGDHKSCHLGQWLSTLAPDHPDIQDVLSRMEQPHADVHRAAKKAIEEYNAGKHTNIEAYLSEIENNSYLVVDLLMEMAQSLYK